jgi:hypothetical protein
MHRHQVRHSAFVFLLLALGGCASARRFTLPTDHVALSRVSVIYLGDFGRGDQAALVREKIRLRLLASKRFDVSETPERADASLVGSAGIKAYVAGESTELAEYGLLRLVDNHSGQTIWAHEYRRPRVVWAAGDVSDRLADQMVKQLMADSNLDTVGH